MYQSLCLLQYRFKDDLDSIWQTSSKNAGAKGKAKPKAGKKQSRKSQERKDAEESEDLPERAAEAEESGDDSDREVCHHFLSPCESCASPRRARAVLLPILKVLSDLLNCFQAFMEKGIF